jgi:hypothetical protein
MTGPIRMRRGAGIVVSVRIGKYLVEQGFILRDGFSQLLGSLSSRGIAVFHFRDYEISNQQPS